jgi:hypothetical protein
MLIFHDSFLTGTLNNAATASPSCCHDILFSNLCVYQYMKCIRYSKKLQKSLRLSSLDNKIKCQHNLRVNFRNLWDMVWPLGAANHASQMTMFDEGLKSHY